MFKSVSKVGRKKRATEREMKQTIYLRPLTAWSKQHQGSRCHQEQGWVEQLLITHTNEYEKGHEKLHALKELLDVDTFPDNRFHLSRSTSFFVKNWNLFLLSLNFAQYQQRTWETEALWSIKAHMPYFIVFITSTLWKLPSTFSTHILIYH